MARILVAMSGGVDSSVAAVLLQREGHDVLGVFMRHGVKAQTGVRPGKQGCCSLDDAYDARRVADRLGIPFYSLNFEKEFGRIVDYFVDAYDRGTTPNPCIACNRDLKFGKLFEVADSVGADAVATGHYARVEPRGDRTALLRGLDPAKDQSYLLFPLSQSQLKRTRFPVGEHDKSRIREIAAEAGLRVAAKPDSQEICFVPDGDHRRLLRQRLGDRVREGDFLSSTGRVLGRHAGHQMFTVGQRKGLGIAFGRPMYVTAIDAERNTVVLSEEDERGSVCTIGDVNWVSVPEQSCEATIRIRHGHAGAPGRVEPIGEARARVTFDEPPRAVTPGQAAVFYDGDAVLGGGWIEG